LPVFISYFRANEVLAKAFADLLKANSIQVYLDVHDDAIKSAENVTTAITKGLKECTHMLAVVSATTHLSWWVPFEIGFATSLDRRITTYAMANIALPDYLKTWPVVTDVPGLQKFIARYKQDSLALERRGDLLEAQRSGIRDAASFHRALKADLGQI